MISGSSRYSLNATISSCNGVTEIRINILMLPRFQTVRSVSLCSQLSFSNQNATALLRFSSTNQS
jgi:hypothetical protein